MAARIHLQFVTSAMKLARPITDANGRLVAGIGTMLSPGVVRVLRHMAVQSVLVEDAGSVAQWEQVRTPAEEHLALAARFANETLTPPLAEIQAAIARRIDRRAAVATAAGEDA
ncbi:MAG: hypothetical protein ABIR79_06685 [Candidatus Binatia bacterium]